MQLDRMAMKSERLKRLRQVAFGVVCLALLVVGILLLQKRWQEWRDSELFRVTVISMTENAELQQTLGLPIQFNLDELKIPDMETARVNGHAKVRFEVTGPAGSAMVTAELVMDDGVWSVKDLYAECSDGSTVSIPETGLM